MRLNLVDPSLDRMDITACTLRPNHVTQKCLPCVKGLDCTCTELVLKLNYEGILKKYNEGHNITLCYDTILNI